MPSRESRNMKKTKSAITALMRLTPDTALLADSGKEVPTSAVKAGDVLLGVKSSGVHSNGFSLVRKVFGIGADDQADKEILSHYYDELGGSVPLEFDGWLTNWHNGKSREVTLIANAYGFSSGSGFAKGRMTVEVTPTGERTQEIPLAPTPLEEEERAGRLAPLSDRSSDPSADSALSSASEASGVTGATGSAAATGAGDTTSSTDAAGSASDSDDASPRANASSFAESVDAHAAASMSSPVNPALGPASATASALSGSVETGMDAA